MSIPSKLKNIAKRGIDRVIQTFNNCADKGNEVWKRNEPEVKNALRDLEISTRVMENVSHYLCTA